MQLGESKDLRWPAYKLRLLCHPTFPTPSVHLAANTAASWSPAGACLVWRRGVPRPCYAGLQVKQGGFTACRPALVALIDRTIGRTALGWAGRVFSGWCAPPLSGPSRVSATRFGPRFSLLWKGTSRVRRSVTPWNGEFAAWSLQREGGSRPRPRSQHRLEAVGAGGGRRFRLAGGSQPCRALGRD